MRHSRSFLFLATLALIGSGCGGSSSSSAAPSVDPYEGNYVGNYETQNGSLGSVQLQVSSTGVVSGNGTGIGTNAGNNVTLNGNINSAGAGTITSAGTTTITQTGTVSSANASTVAVTLTDTAGDTTWVTLVKNPAAVTGSSPFAGQYSGTYTDVTSGNYGITTVAVDASGNITGFALITAGSKPGIGSISGTISNAGVTSYTLTFNNANAGSVNGTVSLTSGSLSGTGLTNSNGDTISISLTKVG